MPADDAPLEAWLVRHLPAQRWFADKARPIAGATATRSFPVAHDVVLRIVRVAFADGGATDYVVSTTSAPPWSDRTESPAFLDWLAGALSATVTPDAAISVTQLVRPEVDLAGLPPTPLGVEQSNTSIRYGDQWVVKLNRRLAYGPSPELELAGLLNRWDGDRCAPRTTAALDVVTDLGSATLAIAAEFVANVGDGWKVILDALRSEAAAGSLRDDAASLCEVAAVARLTGDLHGALSIETWSADVGPERVTSDDTTAWQSAAEASLGTALDLLRSAGETLTGRAASMADLVSASVPVIRSQLDGFETLVGSRKTRIHGDYHLGQVLRTAAGPYVAIDFDGEPLRSLAERRAKYSPLRDVAGLLRSLSYASGTVQAELSGEVDDAALPAWERSARAVLLETYLGRLAENGTDVLPREPERVRQALAALEIEKALYEVAYELNNRPSWVWIPLARLVSLR